MSIGQVSNPHDDRKADERALSAAGDLDVERDCDVPISTQIYWQLAYQIDCGRLLPGARLAPVRECREDADLLEVDRGHVVAPLRAPSARSSSTSASSASGPADFSRNLSTGR